jgi:hypothetical protein
MIDSIRVLYLTNIPSPYRVDFFNEIGKLCTLTVLFERELSEERDIAWHSNTFSNFTPVFLRGIKVTKNDALSFEIIKYL